MADRFNPNPRQAALMDPAPRGQYVHYSDLAAAHAEIERLNNALTEAANQISDLATRLGQAEGRLDASELVGVVEGWKARAEKVEAERDEARAQVAMAYAQGWRDGNHPDAREMPANPRAALEAYGREKVREGAADAWKAAALILESGIPADVAARQMRESAAILADMETLK